MAFFSKKFTEAQTKYATYDRELMVIVEAIKHFHYLLENRFFEVCTDHRPIIYSQTQTHEKAPANKTRKITYLSQFNIKYRHIKGEENVVADALSRIDSVSGRTVPAFAADIATMQFPTIFDADILQAHQEEDDKLKNILEDPEHPLKLVKINWDPGQKEIFCDIRARNLRPYVPASLRRKVINLYHSFSHPSAKVTDRLIRNNYVWPNITRDVASYCRSCLSCQTLKISRHNKTLPAHFDLPEERFQHVHIDIVGPLLPSNGYRYLLTIIDRYSRWPEAIPMYDMTAETVVRKFYDNWVIRSRDTGHPLK